MKTSFRTKLALVLLGATLAFSTASVRADGTEPVKRHHAKVDPNQDTTSSAQTDHSIRVKGANTIPTRDDRNSKEVFGGVANGGSGSEYRVPTGSTFPKHYNRRAHVTDNDNQEYIIDKNDQRIQSKNNVGDALRNIPGVTVRGMR